MRASYGIVLICVSYLAFGFIYAIFYDIILQMIVNGMSSGNNTGFWNLALDTLQIYLPGAFILSTPLWVIVNAQRPQPGEM